MTLFAVNSAVLIFILNCNVIFSTHSINIDAILLDITIYCYTDVSTIWPYKIGTLKRTLEMFLILIIP